MKKGAIFIILVCLLFPMTGCSVSQQNSNLLDSEYCHNILTRDDVEFNYPDRQSIIIDITDKYSIAIDLQRILENSALDRATVTNDESTDPPLPIISGQIRF